MHISDVVSKPTIFHFFVLTCPLGGGWEVDAPGFEGGGESESNEIVTIGTIFQERQSQSYCFIPILKN